MSQDCLNLQIGGSLYSNADDSEIIVTGNSLKQKAEN